MGRLEQLKSLIVEGNPIRTIRRDVLEAGTKEILALLASRLAPPDDFSRNSDVGDGGASSRRSPKAGGAKSFVTNSTAVVRQEKWKDLEVMSRTRALKADALKNAEAELTKDVYEVAAAARVLEVDLSKNRLSVIPEGLATLDQYTTLFSPNLRSFPLHINQHGSISSLSVAWTIVDISCPPVL